MKSYLDRITKRLLLGICFSFLAATLVDASSHREAPLISNDPLADNTDVYAFRSPDDPNTITIIANYIPMQLPHGGPNYYTFGENIRYEIHIDNDASTPGDDITYRFTFTKVNEDPTTFFNIRLGAQNQKVTYTMEKSTDGGQTFVTVVSGGIVPPYNVGDRSISGAAGLNTTYATLFNGAITTAQSGESVFCGHIEDPFFVDLGGIFDLGDAPRQNGMPRDGLACYNVSTIAIKIPISDLQKDGLSVSQAANILDSDFVIGVWASASRRQIRTLNTSGTPSFSGDWVQVSRLGMPLTNEVVIAVGDKDYWNSITPYQELADLTLDEYFYNPELALYMDEDNFASAVPAFAPLRIQTNSLGTFDFSNGADGLFILKNTPVLDGTVFEDGSAFEDLLLPAAGKPRSVDLWPIFHTGVPNARPYQLATGKNGDPLAAGKPFINNFLPNGGDMLRLNMAVPVTDRNSEAFSSLGLIQAAVLGLTDPTYAGNSDLQFIPNMDGFPNGRRLEDDVTRIELQAVAGLVLAAIGLWEDDYDPMTSDSPVTPMLLAELTYSTGVEANDVPFSSTFPYVQLPFSGTSACSGLAITYVQPEVLEPTEFEDGPCDNFAFYLVDHTFPEDMSNLYQVTIEDGSANLTFIATCPDEVHIAFNEANGLIYAVRKDDGAIKTINPADENPVYSEAITVDFPFTQITQAVFSEDGKLLVGSANQNRIYSIDVMNGNTVATFDGYSPIEGGDLAYALDGSALYMTSRDGNGSLFSIGIQGISQDILLGSVPPLVTGTAVMPSGNLLVSANGMTNFVVKGIDGSDVSTIPVMLDGAAFTLNDGDLTSGCIDGITPTPSFEPGGQCYATEVVSYTQGSALNGGDVAFERTNPEQALGEPERTDAIVFVSLGYGGSLTLGFDGSVANIVGNDLEVVETTFGNNSCATYPEFADVYVSQNGVNFFFVKTVCRADGFVDISDAEGTPELEFINYVRIDNNDDQSNTPDAFDVDGVVALPNCAVEPGGFDDAVTTFTSYPNPTTGISQVVFVPAVTNRTVVEVYDMSGRMVETLFNAEAQGGQEYRLQFDGSALPNGVYVYRLTTGETSEMTKFMIAK